MPRALGQIDARKHEAIMDAAVAVLAERGVHAPIEEVARRAGVSKQTVYNHYGSKTELVRTLMDRRRSAVTAPLEQPGALDDPEATLAAYARVILEVITTATSVQLLRMAITSANDMPDMARAVYEAGSMAARTRLAEFLADQPAALQIEDPRHAAEAFMGMVTGGVQMRLLMGLDPEIAPAEIPARARDCAMRFMRAYGVRREPPAAG